LFVKQITGSHFLEKLVKIDFGFGTWENAKTNKFVALN